MIKLGVYLAKFMTLACLLSTTIHVSNWYFPSTTNWGKWTNQFVSGGNFYDEGKSSKDGRYWTRLGCFGTNESEMHWKDLDFNVGALLAGPHSVKIFFLYPPTLDHHPFIRNEELIRKILSIGYCTQSVTQYLSCDPHRPERGLQRLRSKRIFDSEPYEVTSFECKNEAL